MLADCQGGELIDRIAASAPARKLLFVELLGHTRMSFARYLLAVYIQQNANPPLRDNPVCRVDGSVP